jgi:hypothetical protein
MALKEIHECMYPKLHIYVNAKVEVISTPFDFSTYDQVALLLYYSQRRMLTLIELQKSWSHIVGPSYT